MIFLEQITNQILREEGQVILALPDLGITWDTLEQLFIGVFEQSKAYLSVYDWERRHITDQKEKYDVAHIRHITYNTTNQMQRFMPDVPQQLWEFNPYTHNVSTLMNSNYSLEVIKYAQCKQLDYPIMLDQVGANANQRILLPFTPTDNINVKADGTALNVDVTSATNTETDDDCNDYLDNSLPCPCKGGSNETILTYSGDMTGTFDSANYIMNVKFNNDYNIVDMNLKSKYVGIAELNMTCDLFYKWYKAALLTMIGSIKSQVNMGGDMPFDFNQDTLLERGRQLFAELEELKAKKQHWSNF